MTRKTSDELAEMIAAWLNVSGVRVTVHSDPVDGWHPMSIRAGRSGQVSTARGRRRRRFAPGLRPGRLISSSHVASAPPLRVAGGGFPMHRRCAQPAGVSIHSRPCDAGV